LPLARVAAPWPMAFEAGRPCGRGPPFRRVEYRRYRSIDCRSIRPRRRIFRLSMRIVQTKVHLLSEIIVSEIARGSSTSIGPPTPGQSTARGSPHRQCNDRKAEHDRSQAQEANHQCHAPHHAPDRGDQEGKANLERPHPLVDGRGRRRRHRHHPLPSRRSKHDRGPLPQWRLRRVAAAIEDISIFLATMVARCYGLDRSFGQSNAPSGNGH